MAMIEVRLKDAVTGKEVEAQLPDDSQISDLLPAITKELDVTHASKRKLVNKSQSFEYGDDDSLSSRGTKEKDICLLTYEPEFGGITMR